MTSIELAPLMSDAADRLAEAIRSYDLGSVTILDAYDTPVSVYGVEQVLTALTLGLEHVDDKTRDVNRAVLDREIKRITLKARRITPQPMPGSEPDGNCRYREAMAVLSRWRT